MPGALRMGAQSCVHWLLVPETIQHGAVKRVDLREWVEDFALRLLVGAVGLLPRSLWRGGCWAGCERWG
jgi:hypothetical protein